MKPELLVRKLYPYSHPGYSLAGSIGFIENYKLIVLLYYYTDRAGSCFRGQPCPVSSDRLIDVTVLFQLFDKASGIVREYCLEFRIVSDGFVHFSIFIHVVDAQRYPRFNIILRPV